MVWDEAGKGCIKRWFKTGTYYSPNVTWMIKSKRIRWVELQAS
jgi:hypothetical protein